MDDNTNRYVVRRADALQIGPSYYDRSKAVVVAHDEALKEKFLDEDTSVCPFPLLRAMHNHSELSLTIGTSVRAVFVKGRTGKVAFLHGAGERLSICMDITKDKLIPVQSTWTLSSGGGDKMLSTGEYNITAEIKKLAALHPPREKKVHKEFVMLRIPIVGLAGQKKARKKNLPVCDLILKIKVHLSASPLLVLKDVDLQCQMYTRNSPMHGDRALYYLVVKRGFWNTTNAWVPRPPVPMTRMVRNNYESIALGLINKYTPQGAAHSLYFVRSKDVFYGSDSKETSPHVFALGATSKAFTSLAVIASVVQKSSSPEMVLADPAVLLAKLRANRAERIADALKYLYTEKYNFPRTPSVGELLLHTSGLPRYPSYRLDNMRAIVSGDDGEDHSDQEKELANALRNATMLVSQPGATYLPSPLGYAILLFLLSGWDKTEEVAQVLTTLGFKNFVTGLTADASTYAGPYSLYSSLQAPLSDVATALSNPEWYGTGLLAATLEPRFTIAEGAAAVGYGGWMAREAEIRDGVKLVVYYQIAMMGTDAVVFVFLPSYQASAVFGVTPFDMKRMINDTAGSAFQVVTDVALALSTAMDAYVGSETSRVARTTMDLQMPVVTPETAESARRAENIMETGTTVSSANPTLLDLIGDKPLLSVHYEEQTLQIVTKSTSPGDRTRHVLIVKTKKWRREYLLGWDSQYVVAKAGAPTGAYRAIDPESHHASEALLVERMQGAGLMSVVTISFQGMIYAPAHILDALRGLVDETSVQFQQREVKVREMKEKMAAEQAERAKQRTSARSRRPSANDESSDESDSDGDQQLQVAQDGPVSVMELLSQPIGHYRRPYYGGYAYYPYRPSILGALAYGTAAALSPYYYYPPSPYYAPYPYGARPYYPYWY